MRNIQGLEEAGLVGGHPFTGQGEGWGVVCGIHRGRAGEFSSDGWSRGREGVAAQGMRVVLFILFPGMRTVTF